MATSRGSRMRSGTPFQLHLVRSNVTRSVTLIMARMGIAGVARIVSRKYSCYQVGESVRKMDTAQRASASRLEYEDSETESFSNAYYSSDEYLDLIIDWNWTLSTKKLDTMSTLSGQTTSMVRL